MHWNKKIGRFSKTIEDRITFLPEAHDARDEPTRHGLEALARRWAV